MAYMGPRTEDTMIVDNQTFYSVGGRWVEASEYSSMRMEKFFNETMEELYDKYHRNPDLKPVDTSNEYDWNNAVCGVSQPSGTTRRDRAGGEDKYHQPVIVTPAREAGMGLCGLFLVLGVLMIATIVLMISYG
jgi:hypothetical protein